MIRKNDAITSLNELRSYLIAIHANGRQHTTFFMSLIKRFVTQLIRFSLFSRLFAIEIFFFRFVFIICSLHRKFYELFARLWITFNEIYFCYWLLVVHSLHYTSWLDRWSFVSDESLYRCDLLEIMILFVYSTEKQKKFYFRSMLRISTIWTSSETGFNWWNNCLFHFYFLSS